MIKLIKAEFKKIFHKKSFLIVTLIFIGFAFLTNFLYKSEIMEETYTYVDIDELKEENKTLNLNLPEDLNTYVNNLTTIEIENLKSDFKDYKELIIKYCSDIIYNSYEAKYISKDLAKYDNYQQELNNIKTKITNQDWDYFTNINHDNLIDSLNNSNDSNDKEYLNALIKLNEYRKTKNIDYNDHNYLNKAINNLETNLLEYFNLKNISNRTSDEEEEFDNIKSIILINEYALTHEVNTLSHSNLNSVLRNFTSEFGLFILIYVIMLAGTSVSEEFNKGTIKYLLTKPYKRSTILLSKLLSILILIPIIILAMVLIEILIGGIVLGFNSLNVPDLIYNNVTNSLIVRSIFSSLFLNIISVLPIYIFIGIVTFFLSTITMSTSAAITITFLFYLISNVISNLATIYHLSIFKYFISLNWDFSYLVNYVPNPFNLTLTWSLIVYFITTLIILCLTFIYFAKKDVKNI